MDIDEHQRDIQKAIDLTHMNDIESRAEQESKKNKTTEQIDRAMKRTKTAENHVRKKHT